MYDKEASVIKEFVEEFNTVDKFLPGIITTICVFRKLLDDQEMNVFQRQLVYDMINNKLIRHINKIFDE